MAIWDISAKTDDYLIVDLLQNLLWVALQDDPGNITNFKDRI